MKASFCVESMSSRWSMTLILVCVLSFGCNTATEQDVLYVCVVNDSVMIFQPNGTTIADIKIVLDDHRRSFYGHGVEPSIVECNNGILTKYSINSFDHQEGLVFEHLSRNNPPEYIIVRTDTGPDSLRETLFTCVADSLAKSDPAMLEAVHSKYVYKYKKIPFGKST